MVHYHFTLSPVYSSLLFPVSAYPMTDSDGEFPPSSKTCRREEPMDDSSECSTEVHLFPSSGVLGPQDLGAIPYSNQSKCHGFFPWEVVNTWKFWVVFVRMKREHEQENAYVKHAHYTSAYFRANSNWKWLCRWIGAKTSHHAQHPECWGPRTPWDTYFLQLVPQHQAPMCIMKLW